MVASGANTDATTLAEIVEAKAGQTWVQQNKVVMVANRANTHAAPPAGIASPRGRPGRRGRSDSLRRTRPTPSAA